MAATTSFEDFEKEPNRVVNSFGHRLHELKARTTTKPNYAMISSTPSSARWSGTWKTAPATSNANAQSKSRAPPRSAAVASVPITFPHRQTRPLCLRTSGQIKVNQTKSNRLPTLISGEISRFNPFRPWGKYPIGKHPIPSGGPSCFSGFGSDCPRRSELEKQN